MASEPTASEGSAHPIGEPALSEQPTGPDDQPDQPAEPGDQRDRPAAPLLRTPADGIPEPMTTAAELAAAAAGLAAGHGPVAVDAERASGYRYSQRAYLVQLRRA